MYNIDDSVFIISKLLNLWGKKSWLMVEEIDTQQHTIQSKLMKVIVICSVLVPRSSVFHSVLDLVGWLVG